MAYPRLSAQATGSTIDYNQHCSLAFGAYVQTHEAHDNKMVPCTTGALALHRTGNAQEVSTFTASPLVVWQQMDRIAYAN
jgi:hypothetical protein